MSKLSAWKFEFDVSNQFFRATTMISIMSAAICATGFSIEAQLAAPQIPPGSTDLDKRTNIAGDWQGVLEWPGSGGQPGGKLRLVVRIEKAPNGGWSALDYSIDQGPEPIQTSAVSLSGSTFKFSIPAFGGTYEGQLSADGISIKGLWKQGNSLPLNFVRATKETAWEIPATKATIKPMASDADPSFDVATIKPTVPDTSGKYFRVYGQRFSTHDTSLADLIQVAYGLHAKQIVGVPAWVGNDKFDIVATPGGEGEPNAGQWTSMLQKLLVERYQLKFHHEKQAISVYVLSVGRNGPKNLVKSVSTNPLPSLEFRPVQGGLLLPAKNAALGQFGAMMQVVVLDRPVVDQTGILGKFDFELTFMPDESQFNGHPPQVQSDANTSYPSLFDAIEQQLGLRLHAEKIPMDVLVVDRVEKPSEN